MSILRSYVNKNNTIISNSYVNTGRNPVIELNFGASDYIIPNYDYTRFLFDLDLDLLIENIATGVVSTGCTTGMTHVLQMTNTSSFDNELLNTFMSNERRRATSFDLILFRIPKTSGSTGNPQTWDEGVGYDYNDFNLTKNSPNGGSTPLTYVDSRAYSTRPSNWYQTSTISNWSQPGVYNNKNEGSVNFSGLTIVARQHFEFGDEDIEFDMTNAISFRNQYNSIQDTKVSFNDIIVKAASMALIDSPKVNSQWFEDRIRYNKHVHIGVAVGVDDGLIVPVLKFANQQKLSNIGAMVKDFAKKARSKKLTPQEMEGSTFTISNLGMFDIESFTSIINPPNTAILSVGSIIEKPVVKNGNIVVGNTMKLTLACDHRVVDGLTGAKFLQSLRGYVENPVTMLV